MSKSETTHDVPPNLAAAIESHGGDQLVGDDYLARLCGMSTSGVRAMRARGKGPKVIRLGPNAPRYRLADIKRWLDAKAAEPLSDDELIGQRQARKRTG